MKELVLVCTHPSGVVQDFGVRPAIVWGVGMWVVAQSGQHGGDDSHVPHYISWDLSHPLGQCLYINRLDDLVCGPLHPGKVEKNVFQLFLLVKHNCNVKNPRC